MTAPANIIYFGSDNVIELSDVRTGENGTIIDNATVGVTVQDMDGNAISGISWPRPMPTLGDGTGTYRYTLPFNSSVQVNEYYQAVITADGGSGHVGRWLIPLVCRERTI